MTTYRDRHHAGIHAAVPVPEPDKPWAKTKAKRKTTTAKANNTKK